MSEPYVPNPAIFERLPDGTDGKRYYSCKVCLPPRPRLLQHCKAHENTKQHQDSLYTFNRPTTPPPTPAPGPSSITNDSISEDALRALLVACSSNPHQPLYPPGHPQTSYPEPYFPTASRSPSPLTGIDWNLHEFETVFQEEDLDPQQKFHRQIFQATLDFLNGDISDYDVGVHDDTTESDSDDSLSMDPNTLPQKRARAGDTDPKTAREWFPWPDRVMCSLDILMHLPRSAFSRRQLDLFLWLLRVNNVSQVPSSKSMKTLYEVIQNMCGIDTIPYQGKQGHPYHEMSNPKVRPHLHFYPEDSGTHLEETRQASKWLNELSPDEATPMVRIKKEDYYIYEPTMLKDGTYCIPFRWYTCKGKYWARAWAIEPTQDLNPLEQGWVVYKNKPLDISEDMLLKSFPSLCQDHRKYNVPHPSRILGIYSSNASHPGLTHWDHTNPVIGNRWRALSKGCRTLSVPLWVYCDDTSGNQSKKWNKHNSFLFTLAGLPREHVSREYNVHFLCTSNLAPPLEMLDGVVDQIKTGQSHGIWAWDCIYQEPVLLIPTSLSLLGDNPMQSEFACHVGSRGKFFCRMCMVKGTDAEDSKPQPGRPQETPPNSPAPSDISEAGSADTADDGTTATGPGPPVKRKTGETMEAMVRRITDFMKVGTLRTKEQTLKTLDSFSDLAKTLYSKTKFTKARTETGVKDTMQDFFINKLFSSYKHVAGPSAKERALNAAVKALPDDITSPVWKLSLDPHQDTPVEVLHVVLLGFVKYFWRDLVQNQVNDEQKVTLIARLNSINVQGLKISPLAGATLVNYAGSLVGRDFRAICQVAPFVIYDMVSEDVFEAWVALSTLIPLIWQPVIEDVDRFCATLEAEIQNFLIKTVRWTCAWFNKSKFHILLHLPDHIRRLGPAILFATEAFESFNAVIRSKSLHSNRQAPSRDIALAFAQGNRIRHLMSSGLVLAPDSQEKWQQNPASVGPSDFKTIGPGPTNLIRSDPTPSSYLGLSKVGPKPPGCCKHDKQPPRPWQQTLSGKKTPTAIGDTPANTLCVTSSQVTLQNEDACSPGQYVVVQPRRSPPFIACVREILQFVGMDAYVRGFPDGLLVQTAQHTPGTLPLPMPHLVLQNLWSFVPFSDVLCTVNVQHDCRRHHCKTSGVRYVLQERARSELTTPVVEHATSPDDLILNTAQMRDAVHLQKFRQQSAPVDDATRATMIHESVARAIDTKKLNATQAGRGRGSGRGQGRSAGDPIQPLAGVATTGRGRGRGRGRARGFVPSSPGEGMIDFS